MEVTLTPATPVEALFSRAEAQRVLRMGRHPLETLERTGLLPDLSVGNVMALTGRSWVKCDEPLVVVRLGRPDVDVDGRRIGYDSSDDDATLVDAARQWWVGPIDTVVQARHLLVTVAGFVVAVLDVTGVEDVHDVITDRGATVRRASYAATLAGRIVDLVAGVVSSGSPGPEAEAPSAALLETLGHRLVNPPGPPLLVFQPEALAR